MISYSLEYPAAWSAALAEAASGWPDPFVPSPEGSSAVEPGRDSSIRGWFGGELLAGGLPPPASASDTTAMVVGRAPMAPHRVSSWLRRVALAVAGPSDLEAVQQWDLGGTVHRFDLPEGPSASRFARRHVREVLGEAVHLDDAMLAVSELAANAVQHGGGVVELQIETARDAVAIGLVDRRPDTLPQVREAPVLSVSGRGMSIVDVVAAHWGLTVRTDTKTVWCELPL